MKSISTPKCMEYPQGVLHAYAMDNGFQPDHSGYANYGDFVVLPATNANGQKMNVCVKRSVFNGTLSQIFVESAAH